MRTLILSRALLAAALVVAPGLHAQDSAKTKKKPKSDQPAKPFKPSAFWQSTVPFEMTLTINLKKVRGDRMDAAPWEPATVTFADSGGTATIPARVRTRGISRRKICNLFPPLWVDFKDVDTKKRVFDHLNRFKLVSPCKNPSEFERYVIEEYNLYRLAALMTPVSHLTRLIHLTVVDSASKKAEFTRYAFAIDDVDDLAARLGGKKVELTGATSDDLEPYQTAFFGVFQYMIGNTDFSIFALHNAELVGLNNTVYPVVHDFDQAGVIAPPYATPDPKLGITSVTERLYRGLCVAPDTINKVLANFREKRTAINALYSDDIGKLISGNGARESVRWFDQFYNDMSNPRVVKNEILDRCRGAR